MKHILVILVVGLLLYGCSSTPSSPDIAEARFRISTVELTLQQALHYEQYPDQAGLSELVRSQLEAALNDKGLLADRNDADALSVSIRMHYQRVFAGEATPFPSSSIGPPLVNYIIEVSKDGRSVAQLERRKMTVNRGFAQNLKAGFTLYQGNTPETEAKDIAILARGMAQHLALLKIRP